jgi:ABC-type Zn uptake system ZnuABC Zn-binding protein ZnuA
MAHAAWRYRLSAVGSPTVAQLTAGPRFARPFTWQRFIRCIGTGILSLILAAGGAAGAAERFRIVTTTADLKSLAEAVGGDLVSVTSLVPGGTDAEDYQPRPQDVQRIKDARLVIRVGLDFDLWLDRLVLRAGRSDLTPGQPRHVDGSRSITLLDVHAHGLGPSDGHAHGSGNPHYWLDPKNGQIITGHILERLADLDPTNAKAYEANRLQFLDRLEARLKRWENMLAPLKGQPMVAYHNTWAYLARRFRLNFAGIIEERPGVAPSPAHLNKLVQLIRDQGVRILVREPREPERIVAFLAERTGAHIALLAGSVGAAPGADDYLALFDVNVNALLAASKQP